MTRRLVVDTDVFSYTFKRDTRRDLYAADLADSEPCLAFMSLAEIKRWALLRKWGTKRMRELDTAIGHYVLISFDLRMADVWASIAVHRARIGRPIAAGDCWIAAAAVRHGLALLTHNRTHYDGIPGLTVISKGS